MSFSQMSENTSKKTASVSELELDTTAARNGVWLVKVPKYISNRWEKAKSDVGVGTLRIAKIPGQKPSVSLTLSDEAIKLDNDVIPKDHKMLITPIVSQSLGVFYEAKKDKKDDFLTDAVKLCMVGKVQQRLECQPAASREYMRLKMSAIIKASEPARMTMSLDRAPANPKPVAAHRDQIEYDLKKKAEGKKVRDDKDKVTEMLFSAFEKHQYYNIKDLVRITKQPVTYLKEILNEVCTYNIRNPHKNMWELKPEYRHYKDSDGNEE